MPAGRIIALAAAGMLVVLVVGQLVLPGVAENRVAADLERFGPRPEVQVSAFPAIKLLLGRADRVTVRMQSATAATSVPIAKRLAETANVDHIDARVGVLRAGPLVLRDVRARKDASRLRGTAMLREGDLRAALPAFLDFRPVASAPGEGLLLEGSLSAFGATVRAQARVQADQGAVTVQPIGLPFAGLATLTVFDDPRVRVTSISSAPRAGGFQVSADALIG